MQVVRRIKNRAVRFIFGGTARPAGRRSADRLARRSQGCTRHAEPGTPARAASAAQARGRRGLEAAELGGTAQLALKGAGRSSLVQRRGART